MHMHIGHEHRTSHIAPTRKRSHTPMPIHVHALMQTEMPTHYTCMHMQMRQGTRMHPAALQRQSPNQSR
ncbi:hypothetical protein X946_5247 [Burkholderia sp. ABCPW 111]|nr:hypothetical protein X946_5247 [Burkholderia sp. ABCPW 111]